ncbi:MAG: tetratricopeptide repeat protein [Myxococcales bacterium]|nr:tetratricopeptide repeat protein [Myxococcales bacterium]
MRSLRVQWAAVLVAAVVALPALAKKPKADPAEQQARARFEEAQKAYDLARFQEALKLYSDAYQLKPLPGFLFNIAQCHRQLGDYEKARFFYQRYLDTSPTRPKNAEQVESLLAQVEAKLSAQPAQRRKEAEEQERLAKQAADRERSEKERPEEAAVNEEALRKADLVPPPAQARAIEAYAPSPEVAAPPLLEAGPPPKQDSLLQKWWFWAGVGAVAAAGTTAAIVGSPKERPTTLGQVEAQ